jgi:hypothetical protein
MLHKDLRRAEYCLVTTARANMSVNFPLRNNHMARRIMLGMHALHGQWIIFETGFTRFIPFVFLHLFLLMIRVLTIYAHPFIGPIIPRHYISTVWA